MLFVLQDAKAKDDNEKLKVGENYGDNNNL